MGSRSAGDRVATRGLDAQAAREKVDAELLAAVGAEDIGRTRRTLVTLIDMGCENEGTQDE